MSCSDQQSSSPQPDQAGDGPALIQWLPVFIPLSALVLLAGVLLIFSEVLA